MEFKRKFWNISISIVLTWSKVMALIIVFLAWDLDRLYNTGGTVFMYALPFVSALILGKQIVGTFQENNILKANANGNGKANTEEAKT